MTGIVIIIGLLAVLYMAWREGGLHLTVDRRKLITHLHLHFGPAAEAGLAEAATERTAEAGEKPMEVTRYLRGVGFTVVEDYSDGLPDTAGWLCIHPFVDEDGPEMCDDCGGQICTLSEYVIDDAGTERQEGEWNSLGFVCESCARFEPHDEGEATGLLGTLLIDDTYLYKFFEDLFKAGPGDFDVKRAIAVLALREHLQMKGVYRTRDMLMRLRDAGDAQEEKKGPGPPDDEKK